MVGLVAWGGVPSERGVRLPGVQGGVGSGACWVWWVSG